MRFNRMLLFSVVLGMCCFPLTIINAQTRCTAKSSAFLWADGGTLCSDGQAVILYGATFYPYWEHNQKLYRSDGWLQPEFTQYIDRMLDLAQSAHLNTLRVTDYLNVRASWDNTAIWNNMDYLMAEAEKRHMWIILDLSTFRQWLSRQQVSAVYNPENWRNFIRFVTTRYRDTAAISYYSIAGEVPNTSDGGVTPTQYVHFFNTVLDFIHTGDTGNHLVSVGGLLYLNYESGIPWRALYALPYNTIVAMHIYSDDDRRISVPLVSAFAAVIEKPFIIEEFGATQAIGDQERATLFKTILDLAVPTQAAGVLFWNLGAEEAPSSHDVSSAQPIVWDIIRRYSSMLGVSGTVIP